ncbi:MAG: hypothetical protein BWK76_14255 [Desulfobulbaceae bacterium A2]|nr:MAG: hypothetical protein BWK76_14255 [Desulfobulbaceae bacterium A2]
MVCRRQGQGGPGRGAFCPHLPEIQEALYLAFRGDEQAFRAQLVVVYRMYVLAYFQQLLSGPPAPPSLR